MKKSILLVASLAAAAFTTQSSAADLTIYMAGSTAVRDNLHTQLTNAAPSGLGYTQMAATTSNSAGVPATTNTTQKATFAVYAKTTGVPAGFDRIVIKTSWTGSVGGVLGVTNGGADPATKAKFLVFTGSGIAPATTPTNELALDEASASFETQVPDIAVSDVYQASTPFQTPVLTDSLVNIVMFRLVTNYGPAGAASNPIASMNYQQWRALMASSNGLPLSFFTGNSGDTARVYALGRDADSGTRATLLAETGIGVSSSVSHWQPTFSGNTITALNPWSSETKFGIFYDVGQSGYKSGGDLAAAMRYDTSSVSVNGGTAGPIYLVAAVSTGDAGTATAASGAGAGAGKVISFEGYDSSALSATNVGTKVSQGAHQLWSYAHMLHNLPAGDKKDFYDAIVPALQNLAVNGIKLADMKVQRATDGATIVRGTKLVP